MDEQRIYVVVAGTVQVPASTKALRTIIQPPGRQIAQACHAVSALRHIPCNQHSTYELPFVPVTTIILQCRDSAELGHNLFSLIQKKLNPVIFHDTNEAVYGPGQFATAIAVYATAKQVWKVLDYLPLWGAQ